jgi:hypothetical protein
VNNSANGDDGQPDGQDLQIDGTFRLVVRRASGGYPSQGLERVSAPGSASPEEDLPPLSAVVKFGDPDIRSPFPPRVSDEFSPDTDALVFPYHTIIRRGGAVTFEVAAFQQVAIYEPGIELSEIRIEKDTLESVAFGPFTISNYRVNDPTGRILLGPDPSQADHRWATPSGTFDEPGRYLVISVCVPFLSFARMHGWVEVQ